MCGMKEVTWRYIWEERKLGGGKNWEKVVERVLCENEKGEEWLKKLEIFSGEGGMERKE